MNTVTIYAAGAAKISYTVTFPEAQAHYADVEMSVQNLNQNILDIKMPVWTPGSYLIREYSKNVESLSVASNGNLLPVSKISKNCWRIHTDGIKAVNIKYRVYCFEISVRTSFVDAAMDSFQPREFLCTRIKCWATRQLFILFPTRTGAVYPPVWKK